MPNKADEAIKKLIVAASRNQHMLERGTIGYTTARIRDEEAATELKQALYQDYLRLIGPDEKPDTQLRNIGNAFVHSDGAAARNKLRAEQRLAGRKYYGVDT